MNWFEENICRVVGDGRHTFFWYDKWLGNTSLRFKYPRLFELAEDKNCKVVEMERLGWAVDGRAWVWRRRLFVWEEEMVRECFVLLHNFILQENVYDTWRWLLDPGHDYTVQGSYNYLSNTDDIVDRSTIDDVWHKQIPSKVSLMV